MSKIKICGLRSTSDIKYVNNFKPDYIGFIFAESKRKVTKEKAIELKSDLDTRIKTVGVFVNEPMENIVSLCNEKIIDLVQLHGDEDEAYIIKLRKQISNPIIKAIRVQTMEQVLKAEALPVDYLLLDTYNKNEYGGSGIAFNWELIPHLEKPYFLAGGLNKDNIQQAISTCLPYALDISSGVETDGIKDELKIKEVIHIVRTYGKCQESVN